MTPHEHQAKIAAQILGSYNNAPIQKSEEVVSLVENKDKKEESKLEDKAK